MSRTLPPVDDDVFEALQSLAEPLIDDVNSVLRRLLSLNGRPRGSITQSSQESTPASGSAHQAPRPSRASANGRKVTRAKGSKGKGKVKPTRAARGSLLPEREYEVPILRYLASSGGRAPASEVIDAIGKELDEKLTAADREVLHSGLVRWKNRVQFVRLKLIREGAIEKESPRGMWEITDRGRERANGTVQ